MKKKNLYRDHNGHFISKIQYIEETLDTWPMVGAHCSFS